MFDSVRALTRYALVAGTALGSLSVAMPAVAQDTAALSEDFADEIVDLGVVDTFGRYARDVPPEVAGYVRPKPAK